jgi:hypothetical protein
VAETGGEYICMHFYTKFMRVKKAGLMSAILSQNQLSGIGFISSQFSYYELSYYNLSDNKIVVRYQVLTAASMKVTAFWDIAQCSSIEVSRTSFH